MASIGEQLRSARENRKVSLEDAANDVKISKRYLEALEEGDYSIFPAPVYIKGFLYNYARYLELDPKSVLEQYSKLTISDNEEVENSVPRRSAKRHVARKRVFMLVVVLIFVIICLVSLAWWYNSQLG
jgi:cytoskeletal protein RodZ